MMASRACSPSGSSDIRRSPVRTLMACRSVITASAPRLVSSSPCPVLAIPITSANPSARAAATPFSLLQACLGLEFDPFANEIRLNNPRLPAFLDEVMLRDLQLGASYVDRRVRRHGKTVSLDTPRISGGIRVSIVHCR